MKKQLFITDDKGRYYRSKTAAIKASGYKWTSDFTKATSLTENIPNNTIIPTPDGFKRFSDLKVGNYVFDRLGRPTKITGV